jgi:sugar phosphate isomerase/epimerase
VTDSPLISLCQLALPDTALATDIEIAAQLQVPGLSIAEGKLADAEERAVELLRQSRLQVPFGVPSIWTILPPLGGTFSPLPLDPEERIQRIAEAITILARAGAPSVMVCTGPAGEWGEAGGRQIIVEALRHLAAVARAEGTALSIEPMRESFKPIRTIVSTLAETLDLFEEVGDPDLGIVFDIWHMWDSPGVESDLPHALPLFHAVQIADYRNPTRGPQDRVVAGDGIADVPKWLRLLRSLGYSGWYDLEVFSDDGRFGSDYPDSLWKLPPEEFARCQVEGFWRCWGESSPG